MGRQTQKSEPTNLLVSFMMEKGLREELRLASVESYGMEDVGAYCRSAVMDKLRLYRQQKAEKEASQIEVSRA